MLFTVAGSVAMPAQMISLEEAGLERARRSAGVGAVEPGHPGPRRQGRSPSSSTACRRPPAAAGRDRVSVLGLGADGRLVVAELKSGRTPPTPTSRRSSTPPWPAGSCPSRWPTTIARFQSRRQTPISPGRGPRRAAGPRARPHPGVAATPPHRAAGPGLLAPSSPPASSGSARWASTSRSSRSAPSAPTSTAGPAAATCPMISVSQLYPLREVEDFTISPERQLAKEMAESKRRVQDASTVRRLVTSESVAEGTIFTLAPPGGPQLRRSRDQLEEWLDTPTRRRRTAHWQNAVNAPLVWDADKAVVHAGRPGPPHRRAGDRGQPRLLRHPVVARPGRLDAGRAGRSAQRGQGRALSRVLVALARHGSASAHAAVDADVDPARAELHHAALTGHGHALRPRASRPAAACARSSTSTSAPPRPARPSSRCCYSQRGPGRVDLRRDRCRGSGCPTARPSGSPTTARAT